MEQKNIKSDNLYKNCDAVLNFLFYIYPQLIELAVKQLDSKKNIVKPKDKIMDTKNINPLTGSLITGIDFGR
ncbi:MAG TPA: hypothetical protein PKJ33_04210 [Alphaproteobacteria bacterium]|nr:hypothetical protein [Alphaproteobacteria bacterium]